MSARLSCVVGLLASAAWAQELTFTNLPANQALGARSDAVTLERTVSGAPSTTGTTVVNAGVPGRLNLQVGFSCAQTPSLTLPLALLLALLRRRSSAARARLW